MRHMTNNKSAALNFIGAVFLFFVIFFELLKYIYIVNIRILEVHFGEF